MRSGPMESHSASSSSPPRELPALDVNVFHASVRIVNLERASLSRTLGRVTCLLAYDDNASVNLYLDQRKELDYMVFKLTNGIRSLYPSKATVKIQLTTQQRLEITLDSEEHCQAVHDRLICIKTKPADTNSFPRHQPKVGITKPDPKAAYLTPNDAPSKLDFMACTSSSAAVTPSSPTRKRLLQRAPNMIEHTPKKNRFEYPENPYTTYRQPKEAPGMISPVTPEVTPDRWRTPVSPMQKNDGPSTPRKSNSLRQALDQFERFGCVTSLDPLPFPRPQFHSTVPTARVLRTLSDKTRRYGREGGIRKSKRLSSPERSSGTKCIDAVLQALFTLGPVAKDLLEPSWLSLSGSVPGLYRSLVDSFTPYSKNRTLNIKDETVSNNVVKTTGGSLGEEDDAREFLNDTLNQVRQEFRERHADPTCPLSRLFECDIEHTLVCTDCGNESQYTEHYQDFRLEMAACETNRSSQRTMSIGSLFPQVFDSKQISFTCEMCQCQSAMVRRSISKLPDVLVVYLKRFTPRATHGYSKNRSHVGIDDTLEFTQFCSPMALLPDNLASETALISDEDNNSGAPHAPSDHFPSSESSQFSSVSPAGRDDIVNLYSPSPDYNYNDDDPFNHLGQGTAEDPLVLQSDDDGIFDNSLTSLYEAPSEDEQYQWAMEESIRVSQSLSQESTLDGGDIGLLDEDAFDHDELIPPQRDDLLTERRSTKMGHERPDGLEKDERLFKKSRLLSDVGSKAITKDDYKTGSKVDRKGGLDEKDDFDKKEAAGEDEDEDEDEEIKAAILASLVPTTAVALSEKDIREQEERDFEEAIKRSLLDFEDNKENISPETQTGKNGKKGKNSKQPQTLSGSCSQPEAATKDLAKDHPPPLCRANTSDNISKLRSGRDRSSSSSSSAHSSQDSFYYSSQRSTQIGFETLFSSTETMQSSAEASCSRPLVSTETSTLPVTTATTTTPTTTTTTPTVTAMNTKNKGKGKDKAPIKTQTDIEDRSQGLYQLRAVVSHTGLVTATQDGHYVCDRLSEDGIWRCDDGGKRIKIGSVSELSQHRGRSGYLFFYVRCRPEDALR
ncbi:Ubiquitin carboxyl-terminal hydrolase 26 [Dissophora globulifera]|nr:Ubiquitin carboxyl-terminal hydrolase 26 [Dissophora globulifera]